MAVASNTANADFAPGAVAAAEDATWFGVWRAGVLKVRALITGNPDPITAQQFYRFPAGTLEFEIAGTGAATASGATDAVNGVLPPAVAHKVSLHNADPTDDGSAAELTTEATRATVAAGGWTVV